ncbi:MAG: hypothetical protein ACOZBL_05830 [Patescibacteria group bacterium]
MFLSKWFINLLTYSASASFALYLPQCHVYFSIINQLFIRAEFWISYTALKFGSRRIPTSQEIAIELKNISSTHN